MAERSENEESLDWSLRQRLTPPVIGGGLTASWRGRPTRSGARHAAAFCLACVSAGLVVPQTARADDSSRPTGTATTPGPAASEAAATATPESWSAHGQSTFVSQSHGRFTSPYQGANSLDGASSTKETADVTLFLGTRLWRGGEFYLNPEVDQGFGLGNTVGVAGFPSGEAYKVGHSSAYFRLDRMFLRQTFDLQGDPVPVEPGPNALAGSHRADAVTVTVGKFSVVDLFDTNTHAHDPRADFLNWSVIDAGAFDYAADAWGYTYGAAVEWTQDWWTLRGGGFALSTEPNGRQPDASFRQHAFIGEFEIRHHAFGRGGTVRLLGFVNRGRMASYDDALGQAHLSGGTPDVALVRRTASRAGVALNVEQELLDDLGFFARLSANDGAREAFEFTEINQSLSAGLALKGCRWQRCDDVVGLAGVTNRLSAAATNYFAAGGLGILIGDGRLPHPGPEQIIETYYRASLIRGWNATVDWQHVVHPAYNRDRGPVSILGLRVHAEF